MFQGAGLTFGATPVSIDAATFDLTLISNAMTFAGGANSVTGSGHLTLSPLAAGDNVLINATGGTLANTLMLGASDLSSFGGFALTTIGRADGTGTLSVTAATAFGTAAQLLASGGATGTILIAAPLSTTGSLGLSAVNISLTDAVNATGGFFGTSTGPFTVGTSGSITTTDTSITINGGNPITINGPLAAGSGAIGVTGPNIFSGTGGTFTGGSISLLAINNSPNIGTLTLGGAIVSPGGFSAGAKIFTLNAPIAGGTAPTTVNAAMITTGTTGSIASGPITLASGFGTTMTLGASLSAGAGSITLDGHQIVVGPRSAARACSSSPAGRRGREFR